MIITVVPEFIEVPVLDDEHAAAIVGDLAPGWVAVDVVTDDGSRWLRLHPQYAGGRVIFPCGR